MSTLLFENFVKEIIENILDFVIDKRAIYVVLKRKIKRKELWRVILDMRNYQYYSVSTLKFIERMLYDDFDSDLKPLKICNIEPGIFIKKKNMYKFYLSDANFRKSVHELVVPTSIQIFKSFYQWKNNNIYLVISPALIEGILSLTEDLLNPKIDS